MGRRYDISPERAKGPLFRTRDAAAHHIFPGWLKQAVEFRLVYKLARGLYAHRDPRLPKAVLALFRTSHAIGALDSALHLHHFLVEEPPIVWLAIAEHARKPRFSAAPVECIRWRYPPAPEDVVRIRLDRELTVPVFTLEKTAVDLLRVRNRIGCEGALSLACALLDYAVEPDAFLACAARNRALGLARRFVDDGPSALLPRADGNPPPPAAVSP